MSFEIKNFANFSKKEIELGNIFAPKFDKNGLISAIAQEKNSKTVLMLAHMNREALELSIKTGLAHYYSRSRKKLWKKGETSGEMQRIIEMRIDCDQDAILLLVEQLGKGYACHTGKKSCFYRAIENSQNGSLLKFIAE